MRRHRAFRWVMLVREPGVPHGNARDPTRFHVRVANVHGGNGFAVAVALAIPIR